jgi:hypothetical protein
MEIKRVGLLSIRSSIFVPQNQWLTIASRFLKHATLTSPFGDGRIFCADIRGWSSCLDQMNRIPAKTCSVNTEVGLRKGEAQPTWLIIYAISGSVGWIERSSRSSTENLIYSEVAKT